MAGEDLGPIPTAAERPRPARALRPGVRAGLDAARAAAALYVVFHHVIAALHVQGWLDAVSSLGQEAVIVFFLLSGFVIFANESDRVARPRGYYLRRLRRIYPTLLVAMLVSVLLLMLGLITAQPSLDSFFVTLLSLQDVSWLKPGTVGPPFLGNVPLWSLSYEVFFYAVFPLVMLAWRRRPELTRHLVGAVCCAGYVVYLLLPDHLALVTSYFLVWWIGAMLARAHLGGSVSFRQLRPELGYGLALCAIAAVGAIAHGTTGLGTFPVLMVRHFGIALLLLVIVLSPVRRALLSLSLRVRGAAAFLASISYGLYVLHYPILIQTGSVGTGWFVVALAATVLLALVADRGLARWLPRAPRT